MKASTHADRGRSLELGVARALREYKREGRAAAVRQRVQQARGGDGRVRFVSSAPIDFIGAINGGRALAIECKSTHRNALPLSEFGEDQRAALAIFSRLGAVVLVVIAFEGIGETYVLDFAPELAAFFADPWRQSISVDFCRAYGRVVAELNRTGDRRVTPFLDALTHPESVAALHAVQEDRAVAQAKPNPLVLDVQESEATPPTVRAYAGLSKDAIRERLMQAMNDGIARQLGMRTRRRA